ncbi:MAG: twin-arginine translocase subunit TatC [Deltaproteobacteria bacterium]|nr:twin-arginine translocase subunit TatC [Deltaproteobacteria bacterium]
MEHLEELQKRLVVAAIAVAIGMAICYALSDRLFELLIRPLMNVLPKGQEKIYFTGLLDPFFLYLKLSFVCGLFVASPVVLYEIWAFVRPGLYEKERKFAAIFVIAGSVFFIGGALFGYFVIFPFTFEYFISYAGEHIQPIITMNDYFSLASTLLLVFGILFELPLVIFLLTRFGIVKVETLIKQRRYALIIIMVATAIITPTGDAVTLLLVAGPLFVLYEIGILASRIANRKPAGREDGVKAGP